MGDNFCNLIYVAGRKGCGKSTFLRSLVNANRGQPGSLFFVWDSTAEWISKENVIILPSNQYTHEQAAELALTHAPSVLVVDEVDRAAPNDGRGLQPGSALHRIVHYGRHEDTALWCAARRSARVHIDIRALADMLVLFRHSEPRDLAWIAQVAGSEVAERLPTLERGDFLRVYL